VGLSSVWYKRFGGNHEDIHMGLTGLSICSQSGERIDNLRIFNFITNITYFYFDLLFSSYCQIMKSYIYRHKNDNKISW
jgi:hypothetical protein